MTLVAEMQERDVEPNIHTCALLSCAPLCAWLTLQHHVLIASPSKVYILEAHACALAPNCSAFLARLAFDPHIVAARLWVSSYATVG
jgi:hypothetical protein